MIERAIAWSGYILAGLLLLYVALCAAGVGLCALAEDITGRKYPQGYDQRRGE